MSVAPKFLGRGAFTKVWGDGKKVTVVSICPIKKYLAEVTGNLQPKLELVKSVGNIEGYPINILHGKQYNKLVSPKKQLNSTHYKYYKALIKRGFGSVHFDDVEYWVKNSRLPVRLQDAIMKQYRVLCLKKYIYHDEDSWYMEISRRNLLECGGKLVLNDLFFDNDAPRRWDYSFAHVRYLKYSNVKALLKEDS